LERKRPASFYLQSAKFAAKIESRNPDLSGLIDYEGYNHLKPVLLIVLIIGKNSQIELKLLITGIRR